MTRSRADRLLSTANSTDIILFINEHPGCKKTDIYRSITRNAHTPKMFKCLEESGLIETISVGKRSIMWLTPKGTRIAEILQQLDEALESDV